MEKRVAGNYMGGAGYVVLHELFYSALYGDWMVAVLVLLLQPFKTLMYQQNGKVVKAISDRLELLKYQNISLRGTMVFINTH